MVEAGKGILKQALGEQGYRDYVEEKRAELDHWQTLSEDEKREIGEAQQSNGGHGSIRWE